MRAARQTGGYNSAGSLPSSNLFLPCVPSAKALFVGASSSIKHQTSLQISRPALLSSTGLPAASSRSNHLGTQPSRRSSKTTLTRSSEGSSSSSSTNFDNQISRSSKTTITRASEGSSMVSVAIVGAGFSGLCMAIKLQKAGFNDFVVYEAADAIGGTWRANRYPGCACDVQSVMYSYSFEPYYPWTQHYSEQPEILQYLHHCADKYQLWDHIQLNTRVTGAAWDEARGSWTLSTASGQQHEAQVLVMAQGPLAIPSIPSIPGLSGFKGSTMHTAAWDSSVQLEGKKVVLVGTGASAIQVMPNLQEVAKELVVFQRTAPWVLPRKELMPRYAVPAAQHGNRVTLWLQRLAVFWYSELLVGSALVGNKQNIIKYLQGMCLKSMQAAITDPQLAAQLTPNYSMGCKRILASDTYYPALAQPNVQLVASGLKQVLADGRSLEADNGEVTTDVDVIVFATGFDIEANMAQFEITARGLEINKALHATPEAYYGTAVAGFPNLFTLLGLNTGLGHMSVVFMVECQVNLIIQLLQSRLRDQGNSWVEVTPEAQHALNTQLQQRLLKTVWLSGCQSWYLLDLLPDEDNNNSNHDSSTDIRSSGRGDGGSSSRGGGGGSGSGSGSGVIAANSDGASSNKVPAAATGRKPGGVVLWPGLCVEFWWKTLWPVAAAWKTGRAAATPADATAKVTRDGDGGDNNKKQGLSKKGV